MLQEIKYAVDILQNGELIALPTETVYGLAADATNDEACQKIYALKNRPSNNPLIIHVNSIKMAEEYADFTADARALALDFWPGPLTLVLKARQDAINKIAPSVSKNLDTIAIRCPAHDVTLKIINELGVPVAAPSANPSNYVSPTRLEHVKEHFPNLPFINGGKTQYGIESTILDLSTDEYKLLRPGYIFKETLENKLNKKITAIFKEEEKIIAPGMLKKHYSPRLKIRLNAENLEKNELGLNFANSGFNSNYSRNLSPKGDLFEAAVNLYDMLIELDKVGLANDFKQIAIAPIPNSNIGVAINDKLKRAAS